MKNNTFCMCEYCIEEIKSRGEKILVGDSVDQANRVCDWCKYSGGGQYLYYAEVKDGTETAYIFGGDDGLRLVSKNPLENDEVFEKSGFAEWQEKYLLRDLDEEELNSVLAELIVAILSGLTFGEKWKNYQVRDLLYIYNEVVNNDN